MSTQPLAIIVVLGLALGVLFLAWFAVAACIQNGNDAEFERRIEVMKAMGWTEWPTETPSAKGDYPADDDNEA